MRRVVVLAVLGAIPSCAMHASFPVTSYAGTVTTSVTDCATGAAIGTDTTEMLDLELEDRTASAGYDELQLGDESCTVAFRPVVMGSFTLYDGAVCERSQPDGSRIRFAFSSGTMTQSTSAIMGAYVVRVTTPPGATDGCVDRHVTFTATAR